MIAEAPASDPMDAGNRAVIQYLDALKQTEAAQIAAEVVPERPSLPVRAGTSAIQTPASAVSSDSDCANPVVPEAVARRESGCNWDAYNAGGCGGRGCIGFLQIDQGHYASTSPWNNAVSGVCADLAAVRWERWAQIECGLRLGPGAWGG